MQRRQLLSALGGVALVPLVSLLARAEKPDECGVPAARNDGWSVGSVNEDNLVDRTALCLMGDRLAATANVHAVLVARGGKLLFERYFKGADETPGRLYGSRVETVAFDADKLHSVKSVSKSVASLAVGIAIDRGLITGVDEPIWSFFPELSDLHSAEKADIRLSHVLSMSMGLAWVEATPATGDFNNDEARMWMAWDPCRYVLSRPVTAPPGREFFYNTGALMLVSAIIRKATGLPLGEFARATLFEPLAITSAEWTTFRGYTDAGGGLRLRPRDMAKIGQLVLAGGRWNDRQLVSKAWIEASTSQQIKGTDDQDYGYLWWLGRSQVNGRKFQWVGALGRGGQSIRIVPELDLAVVVTAGYYQDYSPEAFKLQYGIFREVLRATSRAGEPKANR